MARMPLTVVVVLALVLLGACPAGALAQAPGFYNLEDSPQYGAVPAPNGPERAVGGLVPVDQRPGRTEPKPQRRCTLRRGARVCRYTLGGQLLKTCVKRRGRSRTCREHAAARGASRIWSGYTNPALGPVVHFYLNGRAFCSGALVTRALVLTAAHCLYGNRTDGDGAGFYQNIGTLTVTPGSFSDSSGQAHFPYGSFRVRSSWVPEPWTQEDGGQDWGLAVLSRNHRRQYAGELTGTYPVYYNALVRPGARFYNVGYPADGPFAWPQYGAGNGQYFCDTRWDGRNANGPTYFASSFALLTTPCEMTAGSSGGPVFVEFAGNKWGIIGVNNRGTRRGDGFGNYGVFFYMDGDFANFWNGVVSNAGAARASSSSVGSAVSSSVER